MVNIIELQNTIKQFQNDLGTINNTLANVQDMDAKKKKETLTRNRHCFFSFLKPETDGDVLLRACVSHASANVYVFVSPVNSLYMTLHDQFP